MFARKISGNLVWRALICWKWKQWWTAKWSCKCCRYRSKEVTAMKKYILLLLCWIDLLYLDQSIYSSILIRSILACFIYYVYMCKLVDPYTVNIFFVYAHHSLSLSLYIYIYILFIICSACILYTVYIFLGGWSVAMRWNSDALSLVAICSQARQ